MTDTLGREAQLIKTLLSHPKALKPLMVFIGKTGQFRKDYGTMTLPEPIAKKEMRKERGERGGNTAMVMKHATHAGTQAR